MMPETDKQRRERQLDELAFTVLAGRYTGSDSWMRWNDWFELTKMQRGDRGLGPTTFSQCVKRLLNQGRVRRCLFAENRFYQAEFATSSSSVVASGENSSDLVAPPSDKAAQALAFLLNKKSPSVV